MASDYNRALIGRNPALTALTDLIETTGNDMIDTVNHVLGNYPLVWSAMFEYDHEHEYDLEGDDRDELTEQATNARDHLQLEIDAANGDEDAEHAARVKRIW